MKKNIICLIAILFCGGALIAQKNVTKIGLLPGPMNRIFSVSQERVLTERLSLQTTVRVMPPLTATGVTGLTKANYGENEYNPFTDAKLFAIGNYTELRIYGKEKKALRGFYWGPYFHAMMYKLTSGTFPAKFHDDNNVEYSADVKNYLKVSCVGAGLQIGLQGMIKDRVCIDWTILGIGFNSVGVKVGLEASNTSANFDFANYKDDVDKATFGLDKFFPLTRKLEPTKVELGTRVPFIHLKTGLATGFGY
jgi:hypothetical protein